jgi:hypothetical protein
MGYEGDMTVRAVWKVTRRDGTKAWGFQNMGKKHGDWRYRKEGRGRV